MTSGTAAAARRLTLVTADSYNAKGESGRFKSEDTRGRCPRGQPVVDGCAHAVVRRGLSGVGTMFGSIGMQELIIIFVIALIIFAQEHARRGNPDG
jgi:hypothetical protein